MAPFQRLSAFAVSEKHGLVHQNVDEARQAAAGTVQRAARTRGEQRSARVARNRQAVGHVGADFVLGKPFKPVLEHDALAQLPDRRAGQFAVELRLAEQHDLQELALLRLEIRQQPQRLERLEWHRLAFVNADQHALAQPRHVEQRLGDGAQQVMLIDACIDGQLELLGEGEHERPWLEARVRDVTGHPVLVERGKKLAAKERLAGAHLARDLDEAVAVRNRHEQRVERLLAAATAVEIARIRGDAEGRLAQAEMSEIVHRISLPAMSRPSASMRSRASRASSLQSRSDSRIVGLSRMTSSFFSLTRLVLRRRTLAGPQSGAPGRPPRTSLISVRIRPPMATMLASATRTIVSVSRMVLRAVGTL